MRTAVRSGGSAALLVAVLAGAWATGSALHPAFPGGGALLTRPADRAAADTTGDGYTLVPRTTALDAGRPGEYAFAVAGPAPLAAPPRLTVVRRDATGLQHPTPLRAPDGTWHARLTLPAPGDYRVVAEVTPVAGTPHTVGADLTAPGPFDPVPFTPSRVAEIDGYQVRLDGDLLPGAAAQVFVTVSRGGVPVTDLEPVDRAFGRLDAVRAGDLAPARVHPDAAPAAPTDRAGPGIAFSAEVPAAGTYRLFLDFRHGGVLRTAVFTVATGPTG
jgi:hypothetical protein